MEQAKENSSVRRRSIEQIQGLLAEFEKWALSVKDFCSQHSVSSGNFHKRKSRYRRVADDKNKTTGFAVMDVSSQPLLLMVCNNH